MKSLLKISFVLLICWSLVHSLSLNFDRHARHKRTITNVLDGITNFVARYQKQEEQRLQQPQKPVNVDVSKFFEPIRTSFMSSTAFLGGLFRGNSASKISLPINPATSTQIPIPEDSKTKVSAEPEPKTDDNELLRVQLATDDEQEPASSTTTTSTEATSMEPTSSLPNNDIESKSEVPVENLEQSSITNDIAESTTSEVEFAERNGFLINVQGNQAENQNRQQQIITRNYVQYPNDPYASINNLQEPQYVPQHAQQYYVPQYNVPFASSSYHHQIQTPHSNYHSQVYG